MFHISKRAAALGAAAALAATTAFAVSADAAGSAPRTPGAPRTAKAAATTVPTCHVDDLYLSMGKPQGAAGSFLYPIRFTNTSTHTCDLRGYPGVSAVNVGHGQIGSPATRNAHSVSTVAVRPDHTVYATIRTNDPDVVSSCRPTSTYVRVYPPASYQSVLIPYHLRVCGAFEINPVGATP
ncbi:DUF4232 domain-containing protein [Streptomyces beihaiensis]|uniref:DUF4232 domain-containing protein n=1 Tax=Streptomyces beihaiensis TaxID=2984495 RepID=A0ABT3U1K3_9ACTN|nr:DUF4232 domain-containing protein [Streptomyces beihaiensis]MCX3063171.1 DUF4232 domain-containing protein [Streptomyces beihaiensis]